MSDSEEEGNFYFFGKPLEPYGEDAFPKKKPISVEDQVATDAQGRRRFHGAFTGGFSAGFYNTVGSLEGWTPSEFKSTRQDKAKNKSQKPEDYMDEEDLGEFGIAPQTVRATSDFSTSKKRKRQVFSDGPIPGEPVLHSLLTSGNETIGYLLLKNIGLRGKSKEPDEATTEDTFYGCEMPKTYEILREEDVAQYAISEIYKEYLKKPKDNSFGLGYVGLDKSHINLFKSTKLVIKEKNKKKVSISGQAFGVGAFEDDDEDIYVKDDMSRYDFELTGEKVLKKEATPKSDTIFDDFTASKTDLKPKEVFSLPTIPHSFTGIHKVRRSRFEPLPSETQPTPERKEMNPELRARCLGEEVPIPQTETHKKTIDKPETSLINQEKESEDAAVENSDIFSVSATGLVFDRFVSASKEDDVSNILEEVQKSETLHGTQDMRDAAKMKLFGPLTRITTDWQPCSLLCKRFNVPEPHIDELNPNKNRKRTKNLIFEYAKFAAVNVDLKPGLAVKQEVTSSISTMESNDANTLVEEQNTSKSEESQSVVSASEDDAQASNNTKDITDKIDVDKNIDLFKAIFLSSSESEGEEEKEKDKTEEKSNNFEEMKNTILSESLLPKIVPIKEGILSNMDFSVFQNPASTVITEETPEQVKNDAIVQRSELSYGPSLPAVLPNTSTTSIIGKPSYNDDDEWIEKTNKDKKHKKDKKKHKTKKSSHIKKRKHSRD